MNEHGAINRITATPVVHHRLTGCGHAMKVGGWRTHRSIASPQHPWCIIVPGVGLAMKVGGRRTNAIHRITATPVVHHRATCSMVDEGRWEADADDKSRAR